jgi:hypothetical protein
MPQVRRLGDGYEPHVDELDGKLTYSLPVDSSFVSVGFSFEIGWNDLNVLLTDAYRRAVLEVVAHTVLQRSMLRGSERVTQTMFEDMVFRILHSTPGDLAEYVRQIDREHNILIGYFVDEVLARRSASEA